MKTRHLMEILTHFDMRHVPLFGSPCGCVCVLAGKGKVKAGKSRPRKGGGGGGGGDDDPDAAAEPVNREDATGVTSGRGMGGSAPATPTEAETATNQSVIGSWSRNSLRGSKCNAIEFLSCLI